jgi:hypothetical protein
MRLSTFCGLHRDTEQFGFAVCMSLGYWHLLSHIFNKLDPVGAFKHVSHEFAFAQSQIQAWYKYKLQLHAITTSHDYTNGPAELSWDPLYIHQPSWLDTAIIFWFWCKSSFLDVCTVVHQQIKLHIYTQKYFRVPRHQTKILEKKSFFQQYESKFR